MYISYAFLRNDLSMSKGKRKCAFLLLFPICFSSSPLTTFLNIPNEFQLPQAKSTRQCIYYPEICRMLTYWGHPEVPLPFPFPPTSSTKSFSLSSLQNGMLQTSEFIVHRTEEFLSRKGTQAVKQTGSPMKVACFMCLWLNRQDPLDHCRNEETEATPWLWCD